MKSHSLLRSASLSAGLLVLSAATSFGQAAPAAPAPAAGGGGGGGGGGRGGAAAPGTAGLARPMPAGGLPSEGLQPPALNDLELTEITRLRMQGTIAAANKAMTEARAELTKAVFATPANAQNIAAKVAALAAAEQSLAISRADAFATLTKTLTGITPAKKTALTNAISGGRGGG